MELEAEHITLTKATKESVYLKLLLTELVFDKWATAKLHKDNMAALKIQVNILIFDIISHMNQ